MPKVSAKQTNLPHKCAACGGSWQLAVAANGAGPLPAQTGVKSKRLRGRQREKERNVARQSEAIKSKANKANRSQSKVN